MKVYVSADIEGVACIAAPSEADKSSADYAAFRDQMSAEVAAACAGAFEAGATEILVKDAHGTGRNMDPHRLIAAQGQQLRLIRGWSGHPFSMVQGLDESFDAVVFVGFHSAAGRAGNPLAHTVSGRLFSRIELNGQVASECYLFALAAGSVGVPVCFLSGDRALCEDTRAFIPGITTVVTLQGVGASVESILPPEAVRQIRDGTRQALGAARPKPLALPGDFLFTLEFAKPAEAYARSFYPGVKQTSDRELVLETKNYFDVLTFLKIASKMS